MRKNAPPEFKPRPDEILIRCDRTSILGNPFILQSKIDRNKVCNQYDAYFKEEIAKGTSTPFHKELMRIKEISRTHKVAIACWCAPQRCHTETIKTFLNNIP
jgi:hypothetical protein